MTDHPPVEPESLDRASIPRIHPHFRLQWEEAQRSFVLLYPEGMVKLNQSAGEVLSYCDGSSTIDSIIAQLNEKFPEADTLEADVLEFLSDAINRHWLVL